MTISFGNLFRSATSRQISLGGHVPLFHRGRLLAPCKKAATLPVLKPYSTRGFHLMKQHTVKAAAGASLQMTFIRRLGCALLGAGILSHVVKNYVCADKHPVIADTPIEQAVCKEEVKKAATALKAKILQPNITVAQARQALSPLNYDAIIYCLNEKEFRQKFLDLCKQKEGDAIHQLLLRVVNESKKNMPKELHIAIGSEMISCLINDLKNPSDPSGEVAAVLLKKLPLINAWHKTFYLMEENLLQALIQRGVLQDLYLNPKFSILKGLSESNENDHSVYSLFTKSLICHGCDDLIIKAFKKHLRGRLALPKDFLQGVIPMLNHEARTTHFKPYHVFVNKMSQVILETPISDLSEFALSQEDGVFINVLSYAEKMPVFPLDRWQGIFLKSIHKEFGLNSREPALLAWCLAFELPLERLGDPFIRLMNQRISIEHWKEFFASTGNGIKGNYAFIELSPLFINYSSNNLPDVLKMQTILSLTATANGNYAFTAEALFILGCALDEMDINTEIDVRIGGPFPAESIRSSKIKSIESMGMALAPIKEARMRCYVASQIMDLCRLATVPECRQHDQLVRYCAFYGIAHTHLLVKNTSYPERWRDSALFLSEILYAMNEKELDALVSHMRRIPYIASRIFTARALAPASAGYKKLEEAIKRDPKSKKLLEDAETAVGIVKSLCLYTASRT